MGEKGIEIYVPPSPVFPKRTKEEGTKKKSFVKKWPKNPSIYGEG